MQYSRFGMDERFRRPFRLIDPLQKKHSFKYHFNSFHSSRHETRQQTRARIFYLMKNLNAINHFGCGLCICGVLYRPEPIANQFIEKHFASHVLFIS